MTHPRAAAVAFTLSVVLAGVVCEAAARVMFPRPPDAYREPPIWYQPDPEAGYVHVPNQQGWIDEGWVTINRHGCRGDEPSVPKPAGVTRVLAMGDSLTLGWGVNDRETFPFQVQTLLADRLDDQVVEVTNCGVSGYHTGQQTTLIDRLAPALEADLVLVGFYWNDLPNLTRAARSIEPGELASGSEGEAFRLGRSPSRVDRLMRKSRALHVSRGAYRALRRVISGQDVVDLWNEWEAALLAPDASPEVEEAWRVQQQRFVDLASTFARHGTSGAVVLLPSRTQAALDDGHRAFRDRAADAAARAGLGIIDAFEPFLEAESLEPLYIPYDRDHPTARGYALIAGVVAQALTDHLTEPMPPVEDEAPSHGTNSLALHPRP
jgi:lysophospholipase L1-like esterase